ncbi:MAG: presenilin family intramembrane aspartyl protease [Patescibacteria group bacterium]|nr:presenilin family intramembrane aspartyl protease [Patescibacteria group bacterium]
MPSPKQKRSNKSRPSVSSDVWFIIIQELFHWALISGVAMAVMVSVGSAEQVGGVARASFSSWGLLVTIAIATIVLLWLIRTKVGGKIFGALFALAIFSGVFTAISTLFGLAVAVIFVTVAILLYYNNPRIVVFDVILSLGLAGVAASVGFGMRPVALLVALIVLSAYDIVAVYFTGHMVKLGRALLRRKVFFAMILPERPRGLLSRIGEVGTGRDFVFLGTGDFVLPAMLVSSVAAWSGLKAALPIAIGAALGLAATHIIFISQRIRKPMAALPPIAAGAALGYVFSMLIG